MKGSYLAIPFSTLSTSLSTYNSVWAPSGEEICLPVMVCHVELQPLAFYHREFLLMFSQLWSLFSNTEYMLLEKTLFLTRDIFM